MRSLRFLSLLVVVLVTFTSFKAYADVLDTLQPGHWVAIGTNTINDVKPNPMPLCGSGTPSPCTTDNVMAYTGGFYDSSRNRLIVWGGGHGDYAGNEMYAFSLSTFTWSRIWGPTPNEQIPYGAGYEVYNDGNPSSRHTYNEIEYLRNVDKYFAFGGSVWQAGGMSYATWLFDPVAGTWRRGADITRNGSTGCNSANAVDHVVYDPNTGMVYAYNYTRLCQYDPTLNQWTIRGNDSVYYNDLWAVAFDSDRKLMVMVGSGTSGADYYDLSQPVSNAYFTNVATTGDKTCETAARPGFQYDPVIKKFVCWTGGPTVYTLDPTTWRWNAVAADSGNTVTPLGPFSNGTMGRWRYIPSKDVFIVVSGVDQPVYAYKLPSGQTQLNLPNQQWVKITPSTEVSNILPWARGNGDKHTGVAYDPVDGVVYMLGGDTGQPIPADPNETGGVQSGRNELRSYSITLNHATLINPYCPTYPIPDGPDETGPAWDTTRRRLWYMASVSFFDQTANCSNTTQFINAKKANNPGNVAYWPHGSTTGYVDLGGGTANPWVLSDSINNNWVYDAKTDKIIGFGNDNNGPQAFIFDPTVTPPGSASWTRVRIASPYFGGTAWQHSYFAYDKTGERIFLLDPTVGVMVYYIDGSSGPSQTFALLSPTAKLPETVTTGQTYGWLSPIVWDSVNNVLLWMPFMDTTCDGSAGCQETVRIYAYNPATNTWTPNLAVGTSVDGTPVKGRNAVFASAENAVVLFGNAENVPSPAAMFLFRYGGINTNNSNPPGGSNSNPPAAPSSLVVKQ